MEELKDGEVAADAEGESEDDGQGEAWRPSQLAGGVAEVGEKDFDGGHFRVPRRMIVSEFHVSKFFLVREWEGLGMM